MPHWTWFHSHVFHFAHFLSVSSVFLFARQFLSLPKFFPKSYRALALLTLIHIPLLLLGLLTRTSLVDAISQIDTTLFSLLLLAITIMGVRMRLRPAYYFAVSWSFLIFAWTTNFLRIDGVLANTIWTKYSVLMGAALEGTLLSLALGDRFNILREENEVALRAAAEHRAKAILASQVSHDIRSPLSALNMVVSCLTDVSEEKRLLIRKAVQRISDIANQLSHQSKGTSLYQKKAGGTMLAGVVLVIIGEKRMQYQANSNIEIRTDLAHGYGLFAEVGPDELARVISNLVDNSVEAIDLGRDGDIVVSLSQIDQNILIQVKDNGRGIPPHVLRQLGSRGVSFGKPKGSGLGLWHAKTTAETCGGTLHVTSRPGLGTDVTLTFPALPPPPWFLNALHLKPTHTLISVDDDQSIHAVWGERLRPFCREGLQHRTFSSMKAFSRWLRETREFQANCLFMIDYEFLDETGDGLSLIQTEDIAKQSVLVTSHFADAIYQRASSLGVCVIPKNMVEQIPIYFTETRPPQHSEPAPPWLS